MYSMCVVYLMLLFFYLATLILKLHNGGYLLSYPMFVLVFCSMMSTSLTSCIVLTSRACCPGSDFKLKILLLYFVLLSACILQHCFFVYILLIIGIFFFLYLLFFLPFIIIITSPISHLISLIFFSHLISLMIIFFSLLTLFLGFSFSFPVLPSTSNIQRIHLC